MILQNMHPKMQNIHTFAPLASIHSKFFLCLGNFALFGLQNCKAAKSFQSICKISKNFQNFQNFGSTQKFLVEVAGGSVEEAMALPGALRKSAGAHDATMVEKSAGGMSVH